MRTAVFLLLSAASALAQETITLSPTTIPTSSISSFNFFVGGLAVANQTAGYIASVSPICGGNTQYKIECTDAAKCGSSGAVTIGAIYSTAQFQTYINTDNGTSITNYAGCTMSVNATSAVCEHFQSTQINRVVTRTNFTQTISAAYTAMPVGTIASQLYSCATTSTAAAAVDTVHAVYKVLVAPGAAIAALAML